MRVTFLFGQKAKEFLLRFFVAFAALFLLVEAIKLPFLYEAIASFEAAALSSFGIAAVSQGAFIHATNASFEIVAECSGLVMVSMLAALLFASKAKNSLQWLVAGGVFLFLFNLLRLFATLYAGVAWGPYALDVVHALLWFVDAGVVVAIWGKAEKFW